MALFTKTEQHGRLHYILRLAFERIKGDMHNLFHWNHYFQQKHQHHDERLSRIEQKLHAFPSKREEIKQVIDQHYPYYQLTQRMEEIKERLDVLESRRTNSRIALKERLLKKVTKNSKAYIKSVILGTIKRYGRIQGPQLKEIIVEEQGICSKSSFYRLLTEIQQEQDLGSFTAGKEKTYFLKSTITR